MRWGALARNAVVIAAWVGSMYALAAVEPDAGVAYGVGLTVTVLAGALLRAWWAIAVPLVALGVLFGVAYVADPSCTDCGEDDWRSLALLNGILVLLPATIAMTVGVSLRRGAELLAGRQRSPRRERPAP